VDRRYLWWTIDDVELLRRRAKLPELIGAESWEMLPVAFGPRAINVDVRGLDPEAMAVRGVGLAAGRGITREDVEHRRRIAVLGDKVRRRLLGVEGGLGSWIRIAGKPFKVVGLLEHVGTQLSRDRLEIDEHAWIPISTMQANWPRWWTDEFVVSKIIYRMRDRQRMEDTEKEVRAILAERLGVASDDVEAVGIWSSLKLLNKLPIDQTQGLMFVLATATLVIGGIGVLNMMLDAVHERRQEIGVRLAIGARRRDIVLQFFVETFTIALVGGLVGAAFGIAGCAAFGLFELPDFLPIPLLSGRVVALALGVLSGVALAAGVIPAWRAARVDPALTLRME
jgi:putative ABC transport system permease protein